MVTRRMPIEFGFGTTWIGNRIFWPWTLGWSRAAHRAPTSFVVHVHDQYSRADPLRIVGRDTASAPPLRWYALHLLTSLRARRRMVLRGEVAARDLTGRAEVRLQLGDTL